MKIGVARTKITPRAMGIDLWGYGFYLDRKAKGVADDLYASAVEFNYSGRKALTISCDIGNLDRSFIDECSRELLEETGYDQINLCASHTHSAPAGCDMRGVGALDSEYREFLKKQIFNAALYAHQDVEAVDIVTAITKAEINENRAFLDGETNNNIYAILAQTESNKIKSIIYNYAAHPVNAPKIDQGPESFWVSAGFPGYANRYLSDKVGCIPMFLQGSCGDVNILDQGVFRKAKEHGHVIAEKILAAPTSMIDTPDMRLGKIKIELPAIIPTKEFVDDTLQKLPVNNPAFERLLEEWKKDTIKGIAEDAFSDVLQRDVNFLHIGDETCLVFHPFELFSQLDKDIRSRSPYNVTFLNGYSNDSLGYLVPNMDETSIINPILKRAINYSREIIPMVTKSPHLERDAGKVFVDQVATYLEESY
ncbi:MAG: hypothetical protein KJ697_05075 [Nanoarchaeota archaeon]|nr:hypothetical protein [Nanoarchaeota archaeon]MBU4124205.1 hypothetical protein [Nanoarchaeota archaeon]